MSRRTQIHPEYDLGRDTQGNETPFKPPPIDLNLARSYISAVLQCFIAIPSLAKLMEPVTVEEKEGKLTTALRRLFHAMRNPDEQPVKVDEICEVLEQLDPLYGACRTYDVAEMIRFMLNRVLHETRADIISELEGNSILDTNTEELYTEDMDTEDVNTEDADTEDVYTEDVDTEDADMDDADFQLDDEYESKKKVPLRKQAMSLGAKPKKNSQIGFVRPEKSQLSMRKTSIMVGEGLKRNLSQMKQEMKKIKRRASGKIFRNIKNKKLKVSPISPIPSPPAPSPKSNHPALTHQFTKMFLGSSIFALYSSDTSERIGGKESPHFVLKLPVPLESCTLEECFNGLCAPRKFDNKGLVSTVGQVRMEIRHAPRVMFLQMDRFYRNDPAQRKGLLDGQYDKNNGEVIFPETLDITPFVSTELKPIDMEYRLIGMIKHLGSTINVLDYYEAFVRGGGTDKDGNSTWYRTVNDHVNEVSLKEVLGSQAYVLVYERKMFSWNDHVPLKDRKSA